MDKKMHLDHVAVVVSDLDRAQSNYERLGFNLTPRSSHRGPVPPDGNIGPWGTGNHCAMFQKGYFEILGVTNPELHKSHIDRRLAAYEGLHLVAFGTNDAEATVAQLREQGVALSDTEELGRDVPFGESSKPGRFAISNLDPTLYPEADYIVIEQKTRDVLWQDSLLKQPNGVVSLAGISVCASDPDAFYSRMTPVLGAPSQAAFRLSPGFLELLSPTDVPQRFPGYRPPVDGPCSVAVTFNVEDLESTRSFLLANGLQAMPTERDTLFVGPEIGCGAIAEFAQAPKDEVRT